MRVAIVIRHLPGHDKVVSAVITDKKHPGYENQDGLLKQRAERYIKNFKSQFPEFEKAQWDIKYIESIEVDS